MRNHIFCWDKYILSVQEHLLALRNEDLPDWLTKPKILLCILSFPNALPRVQKKTFLPKSFTAEAAYATTEYVKQKLLPNDYSNGVYLSQEECRKIVLAVLSVREQLVKSGQKPSSDKADSWLKIISSMNPKLDQISLDDLPQTKATPAKPAKSQPPSQSASRRSVSQSRPDFNEENGTSSSSDDEGEIESITEVIIPKSEKARPSASTRLSTQKRTRGETKAAYTPRSKSHRPPIPSSTSTPPSVSNNKPREAPTTTSVAQSPAATTNLQFGDVRKYLIFEQDPFKSILADNSRSNGSFLAGSRSHPADNSRESPYGIPNDGPEKRLSDALLYIIKHERLSDQERETLTVAQLAMEIAKYRSIILNVAKLTCPDHKHLHVGAFINLVADRLEKLNINFSRIAEDMAKH